MTEARARAKQIGSALSSSDSILEQLKWFGPSREGLVLGGLGLEDLLRRSLVEPAAGELSAENHFLMMLNSIDITDDECHGLAGRRLPPGYVAIGLRAMLGTATLEAGLRVLTRYFAFSDVFTLEVREGHGVAWIGLAAEGPDRARAAMLEEIWLMALNMFMSWFVGRRLPVLAMSTTRQDHPDLGRAHWAVGAPLSLSTATSLLVPGACLGLPRRAREVEEPIWEPMQFWMAETAPPASEGAFGAFAPAEAPAKARLRDALGGLALCDRQLSRRVRQEHGLSFRDLRAGALTELAWDLLRHSDEPIADISVRLGYAEERSFRRFMRARTGLTPAQIRMAPGAGPDAEARDLLHTLVRKLQV
jgi:hypothetical protein